MISTPASRQAKQGVSLVRRDRFRGNRPADVGDQQSEERRRCQSPLVALAQGRIFDEWQDLRPVAAPPRIPRRAAMVDLGQPRIAEPLELVTDPPRRRGDPGRDLADGSPGRSATVQKIWFRTGLLIASVRRARAEWSSMVISLLGPSRHSVYPPRGRQRGGAAHADTASHS
jgi:hypothetical protein